MTAELDHAPAARDQQPDTAPHEPFPLTATQEAYLVGRTSGMDYGSIGCHGYWEWESATARPAALTAAWSELVRRHPALRTVMCRSGGQQVLAHPPAWSVTVNDLTQLDAAGAGHRLQELRSALSHRVFDPFAFPLWDVQVSLLPGGRQRIHFSLDLLIADAWSYFQVLVPELALLYEGATLPAPPSVTFRQYVLEAEARRSSPGWQRAEQYWAARLNTLPPAPVLPTPPVRVEDTTFGRLETTLAAGPWQQLKAAAARRSVTPTVLMAAAFGEVLRGWGGGPGFVLNLPVFTAARAGTDMRGVVGDFTSTVLLEVTGAGATVQDRCQTLQAQLWGDLPHADYSGVHVARALAQRRGQIDVGFPVVLTSLLGQPPRRFHTSLGEAVYVSTQTPQVTLDFQVSEVDGQLTWSWDYRRSAFPEGLLPDMFTAFAQLLGRLAADEQTWSTGRSDLVPAAQLARRRAVNATAGPVPDLRLSDFLGRSTAEDPAAPAVIYADGTTLTRGQLVHTAERLALALQERGVGRGQLVALLLDKGWRQIAAAHAVTRAGAAYLPLDTEQPLARLQAAVTAGAVDMVVTDGVALPTAERLRSPDGSAVRHVLLTEPADGRGNWPRKPRPGDCTPGDPAYVIFTSGSTGTPKGVVVAHRGAANAFAHMNELMGIGPTDRAIAVSGLHFDLSVYDVFGMFMAGGSVVTPDGARGVDPLHWCDLVDRHRVTVWNSAPALFDLLVDAAQRSGRRLPSLRAVVLAGDWIPVDLPARAEDVAPHARIMASGGPAETCVWSVHNLLPRRYRSQAASIPYGRPMRNQRYYIVDDAGRQVPDWVTGEMCVASDVGLADGYLGDPVLTAERFAPLPPWEQRAYRTGDLGRYLPDGAIEFMGRRDFQVKVNGVRIELGDVEAALRSHGAVRDAVVVASTSGPARLVGFVVLADHEAATATDLVEHAATLLPRAAVPGVVTVLERLPLTSNGKVDRLALAASVPSTGHVAHPGGAALDGPVEQVVAAVWQEALEPDRRLGREDNYFMLGGGSLGAVQLAGRLAQLFDVEVSAKLVFLHPTVQACAEALVSGADGARVTAVCQAIVALPPASS